MSHGATAAVVLISRALETGLSSQTGLELCLEVLVGLVSDVLNLLSCNYTFGDQFVSVACRLSGHRSNLLVHHRLREAWLVHLVVSVEAETNHVDQDVFLVFVPVADHELGTADHGFGVTRVHTEDGHTERLNDISRILETTVVVWVSREAHLVVRDNVHRTIAGELWQLAQSESFV